MVSTVLVVCNHDANRRKLIGLIQSKGFDVVGSKDVLEGMVKAKKFTPDAIFISMLNQQDEAIHTIKTFRANDQLGDVPIILTVHFNDAGFINKAINNNVTAFIPIPENPELISRTIRLIKSCNISKNKKILIVEDDDVVLQGLSFYFRNKGYDVLVSTDGKDGYIQAKTFFPDLIIMDYKLPGSHGIISAKEIREIPYCKDIPIVGHTAFVDKDIINRSIEAGFDLVLKKPVPIEQMYSKIKYLLKNKPQK